MATLATDAFTRANETPIASPWITTGHGGTSINLVSNTFRGSTASSSNAAWYDGSITWPNDQWSEFTVSAVGGSDGGPMVRVSTAVGFYAYMVTPEGGGVLNLYKISDNSFAVIASSAGSNGYQIGDTIRIEAEGNVIRVKRNGATVITHTDSTSPIASGRPGGFIYSNDLILDNFQAGDFTASSGPVARNLSLLGVG